eukprot:1235665-Amphidinium_carterae.2
MTLAGGQLQQPVPDEGSDAEEDGDLDEALDGLPEPPEQDALEESMAEFMEKALLQWDHAEDIDSIACAPPVPEADLLPARPHVDRVPAMSHAFFGREPCVAQIDVAGFGRIAYYNSKHSFQASCSRHAGCTLTKTSLSKNGTSGRPVGHLCAWLRMPAASKADHLDTTRIKAHCTLLVRQAARLHVQSLLGGPSLLACERLQRQNETEEPLTLAGLL